MSLKRPDESSSPKVEVNLKQLTRNQSEENVHLRDEK